MSLVCSACGADKELSEFTQTELKRQKRCRVCCSTYYKSKYAMNRTRAVATVRAWQIRNPGTMKFRERKRNLIRNFGMTLEEYEERVATQDGRCAICNTNNPGGRGNNLHVDHNHETGVVRGLLCFKCNQALGQFKESIETLKSAIRYLESQSAAATTVDSP